MPAGRHRSPRAESWPAAPTAAHRPRRRRGWRALRIAGAAVISVGVVLAATVFLGSLFGANPRPGQRVVTGRTGAEIWAINCAGCHGPAGQGGSLAIKGPAFTAGGPLSGLTYDERVAKISRGKPLAGMPPWKFRISEEDIRKVAAYTQELSGQSPEPASMMGR